MKKRVKRRAGARRNYTSAKRYPTRTLNIYSIALSAIIALMVVALIWNINSINITGEVVYNPTLGKPVAQFISADCYFGQNCDLQLKRGTVAYNSAYTYGYDLWWKITYKDGTIRNHCGDWDRGTTTNPECTRTIENPGAFPIWKGSVIFNTPYNITQLMSDATGKEISDVRLWVMAWIKKTDGKWYTSAWSDGATVTLKEIPVTPTCTPLWTCTDWGACSPEGIQTKVCTDTNNCGDDTGKPTESQPCDYNPPVTCTDDPECTYENKTQCYSSGGSQLIRICFIDGDCLKWSEGYVCSDIIPGSVCSANNCICPSGNHMIYDSENNPDRCISNNCLGIAPQTIVGTVKGTSTFISGNAKTWAFSTSATNTTACLWKCLEGFKNVINSTFNGCTPGIGACSSDVGCYNSFINNSYNITGLCSEGLGYSCYACSSGYEWDSDNEECVKVEADTFWTNTIEVDTDTILLEDYTATLGSRERIKVLLDDGYHYVGVRSWNSTAVLVDVSSIPQRAVLKVGAEKKFDVNGDGYYEFKVKLIAIQNSKAKISVEIIGEAVEEDCADTCSSLGAECGSVCGVSCGSCDSGETCINGLCELSNEDDETDEGGINWKLIIITLLVIAILVIAAIIAFVAIKNKKKTPGGIPPKKPSMPPFGPRPSGAPLFSGPRPMPQFGARPAGLPSPAFPTSSPNNPAFRPPR